jgi:hypothetical protein
MVHVLLVRAHMQLSLNNLCHGVNMTSSTRYLLMDMLSDLILKYKMTACTSPWLVCGTPAFQAEGHTAGPDGPADPQRCSERRMMASRSAVQSATNCGAHHNASSGCRDKHGSDGKRMACVL